MRTGTSESGSNGVRISDIQESQEFKRLQGLKSTHPELYWAFVGRLNYLSYEFGDHVPIKERDRLLRWSDYGRARLWLMGLTYRLILNPIAETVGGTQSRYREFCVWAARLHALKWRFLRHYLLWHISMSFGYLKSPNYRQRLAHAWLAERASVGEGYFCEACGSPVGGVAKKLWVHRSGSIRGECPKCDQKPAFRYPFGFSNGSHLDPPGCEYLYQVASDLSGEPGGLYRLSAAGALAIGLWTRVVALGLLCFLAGTSHGLSSVVAFTIAGLVAVSLVHRVVRRK